MVKKMLIILLISILIKSIISKSSDDFCYPVSVCKTRSKCPLICKGKHSYKCENDLCTTNKSRCDVYTKFKKSTLAKERVFKTLHVLINFRSTIKTC